MIAYPALGQSLKGIADSRGLSVPTVSMHRARAMRKLGIESQAWSGSSSLVLHRTNDEADVQDVTTARAASGMRSGATWQDRAEVGFQFRYTIVQSVPIVRGPCSLSSSRTVRSERGLAGDAPDNGGRT